MAHQSTKIALDEITPGILVRLSFNVMFNISFSEKEYKGNNQSQTSSK